MLFLQRHRNDSVFARGAPRENIISKCKVCEECGRRQRDSPLQASNITPSVMPSTMSLRRSRPSKEDKTCFEIEGNRGSGVGLGPTICETSSGGALRGSSRCEEARRRVLSVSPGHTWNPPTAATAASVDRNNIPNLFIL